MKSQNAYCELIGSFSFKIDVWLPQTRQDMFDCKRGARRGRNTKAPHGLCGGRISAGPRFARSLNPTNIIGINRPAVN